MSKPVVKINRAKWRFGGDGVGENLSDIFGDTCLCNKKGYKCCLGFASLQLIPSLKNDDILNYCFPCSIKLPLPVSKYKHANLLIVDENIVPDWVETAIDYNDDSSYSVEERDKRLTDLFDQNGITLQFEGDYTKKQLKALQA